MVFFTSRHRVKKLGLSERLWMTPVAYVLKYIAGGVTFIADKFDEEVTAKLVVNAISHKEVKQ